MHVEHVPIRLIDPSPFNPASRTEDSEDLLALLANIRERGLLNPVRVVRVPETGRYSVVCGHRRLECKRRLGHPDVACVVADGPADAGRVLVEQISENVHRRAYKPVELGRVIEQLREKDGLSGREVAARLHCSPALVSQHLSLLRLPPHLREAVDAGRLPFSVALLLVQAEDDGLRDELARKAMSGASRAAITAEMRSRDRPADGAVRRTLRAGEVSVIVPAGLDLDRLIEGVESLLKRARTARAGGQGLDALVGRRKGTPSPK